MRQLRRLLVPLLLLLVCPPLVILVWYTQVALGGSFASLLTLLQKEGVLSTIMKIWGPLFFGSKTAWTILGFFAGFQLLLMKVIPGRTYHGPVTPRGNTPVYKDNGVASFFATLFTFYFATDFFQLFSATIIYDHFGFILGALNLFSLCFCLFLFAKGRLKPSSSDSGTTSNPIFDFFWGTELFPRIFGWDVKQFTNCRFGMMGWALIILSFAAKQKQMYGLSDAMFVSVTLQLVYIAKFFFWETGYMKSMDIMHDRAGFMICWGCLVWVPGIYTSPTLYLVNHPNHLGSLLSGILLSTGIAAIAINYLADRQRQKIRSSQGECLIWRKKPELIKAAYVTKDGRTHEAVFLASGWWGVARHFHYVPELLATLCWSLPALFSNTLPYFYFVFLVLLLVDRSKRHDRRCALKYGKAWEEYCARVPYKMIPKIY